LERRGRPSFCSPDTRGQLSDDNQRLTAIGLTLGLGGRGICRLKPLRLWSGANFSVGFMTSKSKKRKIKLSWVGPFSVSRVNKQCWTEPSLVAGSSRRLGSVS
jgi:hypothetical protein